MSFFFVVITVLSLMYGYIGWRMIIPAALGMPWSLILWVVLVIFALLPFVPVIMRFNGIEGTAVDIAAWVGYLSFGFLTLLFALLLFKDVGWLIYMAIKKSIFFAGQTLGSGDTVSETVDPQRRRILVNSINLGLLGVTSGLIGYGMYQAMRRPDVIELDIPIKGLPEQFEGFRIVQITDLHVSHTVRRPFIETVVRAVNELKPDLIALTGDLVDGSVRQLGGDVAPLADLKAPYGRYFITGNHEYYSGVQPWLEETARLGFDVLLNEHRIISKGEAQIVLAGVTDYSGGGFSAQHLSDPRKAIEGAANSSPKILLAHQPKSIFEAARAGYDFVISGHTHGGQYFPYHVLAAMTQPYISGLHKHDDTLIYVSRGTGYWGPQIRIGAKSEITVHRLVSA
ncbi:MAG: metallophosphoesterase [Candidatus Zixiibacteriota bacterium]|nr:MAG: metallophosphoesterase [candidate division Zixibacteria bacterium]